MNESTLAILAGGILLLPLLGVVITATTGPRLLKGNSHWPIVLGVGGAAVAAFLLLLQVAGAEEAHRAEVIGYPWFAASAGEWFYVRFLIDPLTAVMCAMVTFVATLIVIYSKEYMRHDGHPERGYERFFVFLGLFVFSMCMLVLGGNFLLLYLGWEAVGLCSYLLIGFYYQRPSAAAAAKKAFLVNRIGDFGFGLGILLIYLTFNAVDYTTVFESAKAVLHHDPDQLVGLLGIAPDAVAERAALITDRLPIIALLLLCGAVGKSAQLPLYVWLPDAMEGPSPVSALIHAATMVTAGVYMMVRCGVIFTSSDAVMTLVASLGAVTAIYAATIALVQTDMKRILAYSTISQLGYMFLGVGVFAADAAIFHLFTHAFFKALLFLAAGSVMHAMGGIIDLREFGGLRRVLPWTFRFTLIGAAALAGFPLLAGFWSKDEIVHAALTVHPLLGVIALVTAALTAFYTFRMVFLAFYGDERIPEGAHPRESGPWMLVPLGVLSVGALFAGFVGVTVHGGGFLGFLEPHGGLHHFLAPAVTAFAGHGHGADAAGAAASGGLLSSFQDHWLMYLSALIAVVWIFVAYVMYVSRPWLPQLVRNSFDGVYRVLLNKYFVDEGYDKTVVRPLWRSGIFCFRLDEFVIDGVLWIITAVPRLVGYTARLLQRGALQGYGLSMVTGAAIILVLVLLT